MPGQVWKVVILTEAVAVLRWYGKVLVLEMGTFDVWEREAER